MVKGLGLGLMDEWNSSEGIPGHGLWLASRRLPFQRILHIYIHWAAAQVIAVDGLGGAFATFWADHIDRLIWSRLGNHHPDIWAPTRGQLALCTSAKVPWEDTFSRQKQICLGPSIIPLLVLLLLLLGMGPHHGVDLC